MSNRSMGSRLIENGPRNGEFVPVEVDTHSLSLIEFSSGVVGSMTMSFDVWDSESPRFEVYGSDEQFVFPTLTQLMVQIILEVLSGTDDEMIAAGSTSPDRLTDLNNGRLRQMTMVLMIIAGVWD